MTREDDKGGEAGPADTSSRFEQLPSRIPSEDAEPQSDGEALQLYE